MWLMFFLAAVAASSLLFETSSSQAENEESGADQGLDESSPNSEASDVNLYSTGLEEVSEKIYDGDNIMENDAENIDGKNIENNAPDQENALEHDLLFYVEEYIKSDLNDFNPLSDIIFWHKDPNEIINFELQGLNISTQVVYPEIGAVHYDGELIAHIEREAYGV